jgi:hypothetical protein
MRKQLRPRLSLEALEGRWVPATVRFVDGALLISQPSIVNGASNITVTQTAADKFHVVDNGNSNGTFSGVSRISITGGNAAETDTVDLGGFTYDGSLAIQTGNGTDTVNVGVGGGQISGNLKIEAGRGNDTISINSINAAGALTLGGRTTITAGNGANLLTVGNATAPTTFHDDLSVKGVSSVILGTGAADVFLGDIKVNLGSNPNPLNLQLATPSNQTAATTVGGDVRVTGGPGDDLVQLGFVTIGGDLVTDLGGGDSTIGNDLSVTAGNGANTGPTTVKGNLLYNSTAGLDIVDLAAGVFDGNVTVHMGKGVTNPALAGGVALDTTATFIGGNLLETGGNGDFTTNPFGQFGTDIQATILGSATFRFGNGANSIGFAAGSSLGGDLNVHLGNGNNTITLDGSQLYDLHVRLGNGNNLFNATNPNSELTGFLIAGHGKNTFNDNNGAGATIVPPFKLKGF